MGSPSSSAAFQRAASAALPRGFTGSGNLFFHLGVDADPPDRGSLFHQAGALVPSGAIHSRVVIEFAPLDQPRVAPTFVLKYNIRIRSLADQGAIEDVLAVENDVVPFDRANVLEQGCGQAFLGDSLRSPRPCDLLACQLVSRREDHGQVSIIMSVLLDVS